MDVLFVTHSTAMQGANLSLLRLILELRDYHGVRPTVIMPRIHANYRERNFLNACNEHDIECHVFRSYWFKGDGRLVSYARCLSNIFCYPYIYNKVRGRHFDVIHSNGSVTSLGAFLSRAMGIPHVWHLREFGDLDFGLKCMLGRHYERWIYGRGDAFVAISGAIREHYLNVIPAEKIKLIYNGIVPPATDSLVRKNDIVQFCMVGLVSEGKNQLEALKAIDVLVNTWGVRTFHLTFIGFEEKGYAAVLRKYIGEKNLDEYVTFLGECNDVNTRLTTMDVGLMLSLSEGFGRVTVEYMMQELAVIASDSGANCEIVVEGETGLIYELGNHEQLAHNMRTLISNRDILSNYAANGRKRALKLFTSERNTKKIFELYEEITNSNHPQRSRRLQGAHSQEAESSSR